MRRRNQVINSAAVNANMQLPLDRKTKRFSAGLFRSLNYAQNVISGKAKRKDIHKCYDTIEG
ncbi:MAG: hypothetical protein LBL34_01315 [Clostridiales bacterium]|jgi:hypothetical protein|nr:hypothetical protein [Clostridiales bacterium]